MLAVTATPQKANAGIIFIAAGVSNAPGAAATGYFWAAGASIVGGVAMRVVAQSKFKTGDGDGYVEMTDLGEAMNTVGLLAIILDADGALPQSRIQQGLQAQYKHIDNPAIFQNLSELVKAKADKLPLTDGKKVVSISRPEFNNALASIDTTGYETEIEKMAKDLE